ncbi:MAG: site-2 protease family protein [Peptococcaceae bacterium]|jgi:Zn-dependent protease|nr:site-2 protease family protein [Peptococcaceae bacterium]MDH7525925.1 site-2 protease family protein [Peptococcaceae bacterium]
MTFDLTGFLISVPAILVAITVHEFSHGLAAHFLGDPTPRRQGRLTLNPLPHLDALGTLMLLVAHFGWAKPVEINPFYFRGDRQRGILLVSLAGPFSNLVVALLGAILYNLFNVGTYFASFIITLVSINVYLALFNLIPVPPLDGSRILTGLLPRRMHGFIYQLEAYGPLILVLLILTNITGLVLMPAARAIIITLFQAGQFVAAF